MHTPTLLTKGRYFLSSVTDLDIFGSFSRAPGLILFLLCLLRSWSLSLGVLSPLQMQVPECLVWVSSPPCLPGTSLLLRSRGLALLRVAVSSEMPHFL